MQASAKNKRQLKLKTKRLLKTRPLGKLRKTKRMSPKTLLRRPSLRKLIKLMKKGKQKLIKK